MCFFVQVWWGICDEIYQSYPIVLGSELDSRIGTNLWEVFNYLVNVTIKLFRDLLLTYLYYV